MQILDFIYQNTKYLYYITFAVMIYVIFLLLKALLELFKELGSIMGKAEKMTGEIGGMQTKIDKMKKDLSFDRTSLKNCSALASAFLILHHSRKKKNLSLKTVVTTAAGIPTKKSDSQKLAENLVTLSGIVKSAMKN